MTHPLRPLLVALLSVATALLVRLLLHPLLEMDAPLLVFVMAVVVAAWWEGWRGGILATAFSLFIASYFFIAPVFSLLPTTTSNLIRLMVFALEGALISLLMEGFHRKQRQAEEALRVRDLFLAQASHDLKTPLTILLGNLHLLQRTVAREGSSEKNERRLHLLQEQGARMNDLIDKLLDVSQLANATLTITLAPLNLVEAVDQVQREFRPLLTQHTLCCELPNEPLMIEGDNLRLQQVLHNLLQNAVRYSPEGGEVRLVLQREGTFAHLAVRDAGIGIPAAEMSHIFERFFRGAEAQAQQGRGLGIGLYLVEQIVRHHQGTISVASNLGQGTTFVVKIPLLQVR